MDINVVFSSSEKPVVRCRPVNAHFAVKIGEITLFLMPRHLPKLRDSLTRCIDQIAKEKEK